MIKWPIRPKVIISAKSDQFGQKYSFRPKVIITDISSYSGQK